MKYKTQLADVAVWGRIPPPIGGMAVHLKRLLPYLSEASISVQMYSVGRRTPVHPQVRQVSGHRLAWIFSLLFSQCEPVHYVFSDNTSARFAASLLAFFGRAKVVLRIGGESLQSACASRSFIERLMIRFAVQHSTVIVGVSEQICNLAKSMGAKRVLHVPGFIPEVYTDELLPNEVSEFLTASALPVMLASGEVHNPTEDDLYGAYLLLDVVEKIPGVRLAFYAYCITHDSAPQQRLAEEIQRRGLQSRYFLFQSKADLLPAMQYCDFMVRPTYSDGDSNSIREALHCGLPVVASDCVLRPQGVVTFPTGDVNKLQKVVIKMLENLEWHRQHVQNLPKPNNAQPIVNLFSELLKRG
jgi:glycosyltransferase involved in cell wall biosynthesis